MTFVSDIVCDFVAVETDCLLSGLMTVLAPPLLLTLIVKGVRGTAEISVTAGISGVQFFVSDAEGWMMLVFTVGKSLELSSPSTGEAASDFG
jgi:hypothetical protein